MKKGTVKKPVKGKMSKLVNTSTVSKNIYRMPSGNYRARKMIDGMSYSQNFDTLGACRSWLKGL